MRTLASVYLRGWTPKQRGGDALGLVLNSKFRCSERVLMTLPVPIF